MTVVMLSLPDLINLDFLSKSTKNTAQQLRTKISKRLFKDETEQTSGSAVENVDRINKTINFRETLNFSLPGHLFGI